VRRPDQQGARSIIYPMICNLLAPLDVDRASIEHHRERALSPQQQRESAQSGTAALGPIADVSPSTSIAPAS
jgi:hypothetical protein